MNYKPAPLRIAFLAGVAALGLALGGCRSVSRETTGSIGGGSPRAAASPAAGQSGALARAGAAYERNPKDKTVGIGYAALLRSAGRNDQSLAVMQQVAISNPTDREVLAAYGKALAGAGDLPKALETVRRAQTPDKPDWRLYSAEGAILDQLGRAAEARVLYRKALDLQPDEPSVLSNLGMSYLLGNDPKTAEIYLRKAAERPGADGRVRQNLALTVGLQGRFEEAERIAGAELNAEDARANVAYLKSMLSRQQNTWRMLKDADGAKPAEASAAAGAKG